MQKNYLVVTVKLGNCEKANPGQDQDGREVEESSNQGQTVHGHSEVERLLDHYWDPKTNSYYYLVKWKGYNELFESRWEPRAHLKKGAKAILKEYDDKNGIEVSS